MKRLHTFLMTFLFIFTGTAPYYAKAADQCADIFDFSQEKIYKEKVAELLKDHYHVPETRNLISDIFVWYAVRQFKLKKMEETWDIRRATVLSERAMHIASRFANEVNPTFDPADVAWINRTILSRGLHSLVMEYREPNESGKIIRFIHKVMKTRVVQFAMNPRLLPYVEDRIIPQDLLNKIIIDGPLAHKKEIEDAYQASHQNWVQGYRQVSRIYATFFIVFLVYLGWEKQKEAPATVNERKVDKLEDSLEDLEKLLDVLDEELARRGLYDLR